MHRPAASPWSGRENSPNLEMFMFCQLFVCLDHFWVMPVCVLEGDANVPAGIPLDQASVVCRQLEQPVGLCSHRLLPKTPQPVQDLCSCCPVQCCQLIPKCHLLSLPSPVSQPWAGSLQRHSLAASSLFSLLLGRLVLLLLQMASRYLPDLPDFYLEKIQHISTIYRYCQVDRETGGFSEFGLSLGDFLWLSFLLFSGTPHIPFPSAGKIHGG